MKKLFKAASTLFLAIVLCMGLSPVAFAASSATFVDYDRVFVFMEGSEYTETDLFDGFKNVMPGDELRQVVSVGNEHSAEVDIYLKAVAHDEQGNPLTYAGSEGDDVVTMLDFLAQLEMTINWNGSVIYDGAIPPAGGPEDAVLLGAFAPGESKDLEVVLSVPIEMGNDYMSRAGEVDWVFTVEELDPEDPPTPPIDPEPGDPEPGDPEPGDPEPGDPEPGDPTPGDPDPKDPWLPVTGDDAPVMVLASVAILAAIVMLFAAFKRRYEDR